MTPAIERHDEIPSTQARALELAEAGAPDGTVVVARVQTAGVGRHGHRWASPPGGLWMSAIAGRPPAPDGRTLASSIVGALAARAGIAKAASLVVRLKWPNDLFAGRRKLGGVIATERAGRIVFGIGIDANLRGPDLPPEVRPLATSILEETGRAVDLERLLAGVLAELAARVERGGKGGRGMAGEAWHCMIREYPVRWRPPGGAEPVEGLPLGLEPTGALAIDGGAGPRHVQAGDLEILWPAT